MAKDKTEFSFDDLNKSMNSFSQYGGLIEDSTYSEINEYIHTGNYMLNACLSGKLLNGGFPCNRAIQLAGDSGSGKTYLLLNAAANAQKQGYYIIWYDSENAIDKNLVEKFGIDTHAFRYEIVTTVQEFRSNITNVLDTLIDAQNKGQSIPKVLFILDSAGNLATQKEIDDAKAGSEKADMTRAKVMKSIFRIVIAKMGIIKATFLFSNHTYSDQGFIPQMVAAGGCLVPGSEVLMSDGSYKLIEDIVEGDMVETLDGSKMILKTWRYEKPTITVEFEDGSVLECSRTHKFFIGNDVSEIFNDDAWISAEQLIVGSEVKIYQ